MPSAYCPDCLAELNVIGEGHTPDCVRGALVEDGLIEMDFVEEPTDPTRFDGEPTRPDDTTLLRVCALCTGPVRFFKEGTQVPERAEAWQLGGCMVTQDPKGHHWCHNKGKLWLPSEGITAEYDRRREDILVTVNRRAPR